MDKEKDNELIFLTNNFSLDAEMIANLYKDRWKIELFFKWIKQHLRIKSFYGTSENAKVQIYSAIAVYVLAWYKYRVLSNFALFAPTYVRLLNSRQRIIFHKFLEEIFLSLFRKENYRLLCFHFLQKVYKKKTIPFLEIVFVKNPSKVFKTLKVFFVTSSRAVSLSPKIFHLHLTDRNTRRL